MGIRDVRLMNRTFTELKMKMDLMKDSVDSNTAEVAKMNRHVEEVKRKEEEANKVDWAKVEPITEEDRYPMIKTSEPGINIETQVLMKKLDII
jgi:hypothetical protein